MNYRKSVLINLTHENFKLVSDFKYYGFKNIDEAVNTALSLLDNSIYKQKLKESAELYLNYYLNDSEIQYLTESALNDLN